MRKVMVVGILLWTIATSVAALEIEGVTVSESIKVSDGTELVLNGVGIRSKFIFDIYLAELYLPQPESDPAAILGAEGRRLMVMHFLYDEVSGDKLVEAWNDGFAANLDGVGLANLQGEIAAFNAMFETVHAGDQVLLEYVPGVGTRVSVAGKEKGVVAGKPFADALFAIWLGTEPVTEDLKAALLSGSQ